jgi:polyferredoxin
MDAIRRWVQAIWFFLANGYWAFPFTGTLYQGPLKVLCSPGLNCYSCPAATTFCPLGSLQQLLLGLRLNLQTGQHFLGLYVLGWMGMLGATFGRLICGWACPFGLFQELLHKIPSPKQALWPALRWGKYLCLLLFVIVLPLAVVDSFGLGAPWFCKYLCPAGTLEAGLPMLALDPSLRALPGRLFLGKLLILVVVVAGSIVSSRFFCRTLCPLGAFYGLFNGKSLIRLKFDADNCTKCGACHLVCPVDIRFNESPDSAECIGCLRCMTRGCRFQAIHLEVAGLVLNIASPPSDSPEPHAPAP